MRQKQLSDREAQRKREAQRASEAQRAAKDAAAQHGAPAAPGQEAAAVEVGGRRRATPPEPPPPPPPPPPPSRPQKVRTSSVSQYGARQSVSSSCWSSAQRVCTASGLSASMPTRRFSASSRLRHS